MNALRAIAGLVVVGMLVGCADATSAPTAHEASETETNRPITFAAESVNADQVSMQGSESLSVECAVEATVGIHLFKAISLDGTVGPYIRLGAEACAKGVTITEAHGLEASIKGGITFPFIHQSADIQLLTMEEQIGDTNTLYCDGGQIDHGDQCDMDQKCTGGTKDSIKCQ